MEPVKRKMIINEIDRWRRSKLLPENYCDFLMNLYLDDESDREPVLLGVSTKAIQRSSWKAWLLSFAIFSLISLSIYHFSDFPVPMQIGLAALTVVACYLFGLIYRANKAWLSYLLYGFGSLMLLLSGIYLMDLHGIDTPEWIAGYVALCSLVWLIAGLAVKIGILHFCGWIGLVLCYGWQLNRMTELPGWIVNQSYWLPISILLGWIGWLLTYKYKNPALVIWAVSGIVWFAPEIYGVWIADFSDGVIQLSFLGKAALLAVVLFGYRKKWTEWVA